MRIPEVALPGSAGTLILIGGGEFSFWETQDADRAFVSRLRSKQVAFVPTASGSEEYARHFGEYLKRIDAEIEVVNVPIYRPRDARRGKNLDTLRKAGGVYIGGGVSNTLIDGVRESEFAAVLREILVADGVIAAIGAAANALGTVTSDTQRVGSPLPALGLLEGTVVESGFDPATNQMLRRLMSVEGVEIGLGIPRKTALVIGPARDGEIVGDGSVALARRPR